MTRRNHTYLVIKQVTLECRIRQAANSEVEATELAAARIAANLKFIGRLKRTEVRVIGAEVMTVAVIPRRGSSDKYWNDLARIEVRKSLREPAQ